MSKTNTVSPLRQRMIERRALTGLSPTLGASHYRQPTLPIRPLFPRKQTQVGHRATSEMCHVWTAPGWQEESSRRRLGRCGHVFGL
jgi:hypothetical protein